MTTETEKRKQIFISALLCQSYILNDVEVTRAVLKYAVKQLSNSQFKKIYKSCNKFLLRSECVFDKDLQQFLETAATGEVD